MSKFPLQIGHLPLDLINTEVVRWGKRHDLWQTDADVTEWIATFPYLPTPPLALLQSLRNDVRSLYEQLVDTNTVPFDTLEQWLTTPLQHFWDGQLRAIPHAPTLDSWRAVIAYETLKLHEQGRLLKVKRCANEQCILLFIDDSGRKKWCSMDICGNRAKVKRHSKTTS